RPSRRISRRLEYEEAPGRAHPRPGGHPDLTPGQSSGIPRHLSGKRGFRLNGGQRPRRSRRRLNLLLATLPALAACSATAAPTNHAVRTGGNLIIALDSDPISLNP